MIVTEELLPYVIKGLRTHGGRRGFILSGKLRLRDMTPFFAAPGVGKSALTEQEGYNEHRQPRRCGVMLEPLESTGKGRIP
jgi:hypothetical protein